MLRRLQQRLLHDHLAEALNDGQWHHVVGTMGRDRHDALRRRQEGRHATATPRRPSPTTATGGSAVTPAWSGNRATSTATIDDVAIYPTADPADAGAAALHRERPHAQRPDRARPTPTARRSGTRNPDLYWRLGETTGTTAKDSGPNESDGIYQGGYTQGEAGRSTRRPTRPSPFNGSDGFVASNHAVQQPADLLAGGCGSRPRPPTAASSSASAARRPARQAATTGTSTCSNDGQLIFGVWTGFTNTITTPNAVNDGQWHHVVATQSSTDGMKLYVDGALVGTNGQTDAQDYTGYWRVGGDNTWGC